MSTTDARASTPTYEPPAALPRVVSRESSHDRAPHVTPPSEERTWSATRRVAFRFAFAYLLLYNLPFPLALAPFGGPVATVYNRLWFALVPWAGTHVLHLARPITEFPAGSGDTRFNYVQVLLFAVTAILATVLWSRMDRERRDHRRLEALLRVYVRYALAVPLLVYGAFKVIKVQFPDPTLDTLLTPYGDMSPMGALWAWMGISYPYNLFGGLAEMVPGVLLFFRRTTTLGALLAVATLGNVVMLNFSYDVPVKLFSLHLLLMAAFLVVPDAPRLFAMFVSNEAVPAARLDDVAWPPRLKLARRIVKTGFVTVAICLAFAVAITLSRQVGTGAPRSALYGAYDVVSFVRDGVAVPPLATDSTRWRRMIAAGPSAITVRTMTDARRAWLSRVDTSTQRIVFTSAKDSTARFAMSYVRAGSQLVLDGALEGDSLHVVMKRLDTEGMRVVRRGFHWVTETGTGR